LKFFFLFFEMVAKVKSFCVDCEIEYAKDNNELCSRCELKSITAPAKEIAKEARELRTKRNRMAKAAAIYAKAHSTLIPDFEAIKTYERQLKAYTVKETLLREELEKLKAGSMDFAFDSDSWNSDSSTPSVAVDSAHANSTPSVAVDSAHANSAPSVAVDSAHANSAPSVAVDSAHANSAHSVPVDSAHANSAPSVAVDSAHANSAHSVPVNRALKSDAVFEVTQKVKGLNMDEAMIPEEPRVLEHQESHNRQLELFNAKIDRSYLGSILYANSPSHSPKESKKIQSTEKRKKNVGQARSIV
jgi:hypothetical protein